MLINLVPTGEIWPVSALRYLNFLFSTCFLSLTLFSKDLPAHHVNKQTNIARDIFLRIQNLYNYLIIPLTDIFGEYE